MELSKITAISPVDGRYRDASAPLENYFSEYALIRYRVRVEIEYYIALCEIPLPQLALIDRSKFEQLRDIYRNFTIEDALRVKEIERTTNHDVKAVEYLIKEKMDVLGLSAHKEFVHFGLTSQDVNNTATPLLLAEAVSEAYLPLLGEVRDRIYAMADEWREGREAANIINFLANSAL